MGNFLKILTSLTALVLFALTISEMAVSENPPPLLAWAVEQLDLASTSFWPAWELAQRIERPGEIYSYDFLWYFLLRGPWEVWRIWLLGSAALALLAGIAYMAVQGFFDEDVVALTFSIFAWAIIIKGVLILSRYVWYFFQ